jgi:hypothetical protein
VKILFKEDMANLMGLVKLQLGEEDFEELISGFKSFTHKHLSSEEISNKTVAGDFKIIVREENAIMEDLNKAMKLMEGALKARGPSGQWFLEVRHDMQEIKKKQSSIELAFIRSPSDLKE